MREETGCDGIMIGRGALGNPWIFKEVSNSPSLQLEEKDIAEIAKICHKHFNLLVKYKEETFVK